MRRRLLVVYEEIDRRAKATNDAHPSWPCRRGCDHCCRHLAEVPRMTRAEWELLEEGIALLDDAVKARLARATDFRVCPLLDQEQGACLVYEHRPAACRTYGYYVERGEILGCERVASSPPDDVVWGNEESVRHALATVSDEPLPLTYWLGGAGRSPSPSSSM